MIDCNFYYKFVILTKSDKELWSIQSHLSDQDRILAIQLETGVIWFDFDV